MPRIPLTPRLVIGSILLVIPFVVFVVGMTLTFLPGEAYRSARRTENLAWDAGPSPTISVDLAAGTITVAQATDGRVSAKLARLAVTKAGQEAADAALASLVVTSTRDGDAIRIATTAPPRAAGVDQLKADLELRVPPDATLDLLARRGDVLIGKVAADAFGASIVSSPVALRAVRARVEGEAYVGIEAELAPRPGLPPTTLDLASRQGGVKIQGDNLQITAHAESGSVRFAGRLAPGGHRFRAGGAQPSSDPSREGIRLALPADLVFEVDARSEAGRVSTDFPAPAAPPAPIRLELRTGGGPIEIRKASGSNRL